MIWEECNDFMKTAYTYIREVQLLQIGFCEFTVCLHQALKDLWEELTWRKSSVLTSFNKIFEGCAFSITMYFKDSAKITHLCSQVLELNKKKKEH